MDASTVMTNACESVSQYNKYFDNILPESSNLNQDLP